MQLKSLQLFREVALSGSFVAAAERLHTVQSNVTAHVRKLEDELGVRLIDRQGAARLTSAGHALMPYVERMLGAHDEALASFRHDATPTGQLRVGAMETTTALRLPPLLSRFHAAHPEVNIDLRTGPSADLVQGLINGQYDCVFVAGKLSHARLHRVPAFEERLVLVSGQPFDGMPSSTQLQTATFLAFRQGCGYRQRIELLLASHGVYGARIFDFGSLDGMLGCVSAGMGYALLPEGIVASHQHRFNLYSQALSTEIADVTTYFAAAERESWSPALEVFYQALGLEVAGPATPATAE